MGSTNAVLEHHIKCFGEGDLQGCVEILGAHFGENENAVVKSPSRLAAIIKKGIKGIGEKDDIG